MVQKSFMERTLIILNMYINYLSLLKYQKKIKTYNSLANSIKFKKRSNKAMKIDKIGKIILKKTINEIDFQIKNEIKKT